MGSTKLVVLALFGSVIAYYLYNPLPENIEQPLLYCTATAISKLIEDMSRVCYGIDINYTYILQVLQFLKILTRGSDPVIIINYISIAVLQNPPQ